MNRKKLIVTVCLAAIAVSHFPAGKAFAQSPAAPELEEPIRMIVNYGEGKEKRRRSREGVMEPVGVAIGQQVGVTLQFLPKRAGELVVVRPLDGGEVDLEGPVAVLPDERCRSGSGPARPRDSIGSRLTAPSRRRFLSTPSIPTGRRPVRALQRNKRPDSSRPRDKASSRAGSDPASFLSFCGAGGRSGK